jgi:hypothetical protein
MPSAVHVHLQLRIVGDDGTVFTDREILYLEKSDHRLEAVGSSIGESKSLQECLQQHIVTVQAAAFVDRHCCCPACGRQLCHKGKYPIIFRTVFGNVVLSSPRFYRCSCHPADSQTFSPLAELLTEHTAPELLYLESRWASLISWFCQLSERVAQQTGIRLPGAVSCGGDQVLQRGHALDVEDPPTGKRDGLVDVAGRTQEVADLIKGTRSPPPQHRLCL